MASQTQSDDEEDPPSDDDLTDQVAMCADEGNFDQMATALNISQDNDNISDPFELDSIIDHRHLSGILELKVLYKTNEQSWHPIEMVKNDDPHAVAQYVMNNDLGKISNGQHRRWARAFLRSLKRTIRRMKRVAFQELTASSYDPNPSRKACSRRAKRQCSKTQAKEALH